MITVALNNTENFLKGMHYITVTKNCGSGKKYLAYNVKYKEAKALEYDSISEIFGSGAMINGYFLIDLNQKGG